MRINVDALAAPFVWFWFFFLNVSAASMMGGFPACFLSSFSC